MPFVEVVGRGARAAPEQIAVTGLKVGRVLLFTPIVIVVVAAHCPASGVNVYVVVAVLFKDGVHVPVMPFIDVVGRGASVVPE